MTDDIPEVDPVRASIGANVRAEMARRGVPQISISRVIGRAQQQVSERLNGRIGFEAKELLQIAQYLDVPLERLMSVDDLAADQSTAGVA
jgi:transcriptional regulator with XRE-family HTH domain